MVEHLLFELWSIMLLSSQWPLHSLEVVSACVFVNVWFKLGRNLVDRNTESVLIMRRSQALRSIMDHERHMMPGPAVSLRVHFHFHFSSRSQVRCELRSTQKLTTGKPCHVTTGAQGQEGPGPHPQPAPALITHTADKHTVFPHFSTTR